MSFLIPAARPDPGLLGRLGRLAFWTALGFAALLLVPAYSAAMEPIPHGLPAETFVFFAAMVALIGRGMRYLLAGE